MTQPETTTWTVHLAARRPGKAVVAVIIVALALSGVAMLASSWGPSGVLLIVLLSALLLLGSIAEYLLPVTYTLDASGAHSRLFGSRRTLPWANVRRVYLRPDGIKLSPLTGKNWAESYRGVMLRSDDHDALLAELRAWFAAMSITPEIIEEE